MPGYNGSGTYQRFRSWEADAAAGVKIRADYHDDEDDGFAAGLSNVICRDGQSTITQNIPFNAKKITNLGAGVDPTDAINKGQLDALRNFSSAISITGSTPESRLKFTGTTGPWGDSFVTADLSFGARTASLWVWNDKNDFSGTDTMSLSRAAQLVITKKEELAGRGPELILFRDSASPAVSDVMGYFGFNGRNSAGESLEYAGMYALITDPINASENGNLYIRTTVDGTQTVAVTCREGGIDTPLLHGHTNVAQGFTMTATSGTGVDTRIGYTTADVSMVSRPTGAYSAGSIAGWAVNNGVGGATVSGDVFAVDKHGRVHAQTGQYLTNMYYDGTNFRSRFAGFGGGLLYSTTSGSHTISGTAATTAANGVVTLRNMLSIDKDGNADLIGAFNLAGAGTLGRIEFTNASMSLVGRQASYYTTSSLPALVVCADVTGAGTANDVFHVDENGNASNLNGIYMGNAFVVGGGWRARLTGYVGGSSYNSTSGTFTMLGTAASVAQGGAATLQSLAYVDKTGKFTTLGAIDAGTSIIAGTTVSAANTPNFCMSRGASQTWFQFLSGYAMSVHDSSGTFSLTLNGATRAQWRISDGAFTQYATLAYKPAGGAWSDSSDQRIKNVVGDYDQGLEAIRGLRPVRYTFKGNDTPEEPVASIPAPPEFDENGEEIVRMATTEIASMPYVNSPHYQVAVDGTEFIGFIAQEAETVMPGMVTQRTAWIDGEEVTDLRDLDTSTLIYALVNAVKELDTRIGALEAA